MTPVEFQFNYPDGRPIAGMEFVIKLPKSGFIKEADGIIMPADLTFETDEQGFALVLLAPSSSVYTVRMTTPGQSEDYDSCRKGVSYKFYVPDSAEPVRAQDLFLAPPPNSEPWDETAIRELTEAKVIAVQSAETAVAASVSAEASAVRAEAASAGIDEDADRAERARDASEAFAIDALGARTETGADRIAAQQAALEAGSAAQSKVDAFATLLAGAEGPDQIGRSAYFVRSIQELIGLPRRNRVTAMVAAYHLTETGQPVGGDMFIYDANRNKSAHDGMNIFSPTVPFTWADFGTSYLYGVGETAPGTAGCWIRQNFSSDIFNAGARLNTNITQSIRRAITSTGGAAILRGSFTLTPDVVTVASYQFILGAGKGVTTVSLTGDTTGWGIRNRGNYNKIANFWLQAAPGSGAFNGSLIRVEHDDFVTYKQSCADMYLKGVAGSSTGRGIHYYSDSDTGKGITFPIADNIDGWNLQSVLYFSKILSGYIDSGIFSRVRGSICKFVVDMGVKGAGSSSFIGVHGRYDVGVTEGLIRIRGTRIGIKDCLMYDFASPYIFIEPEAEGTMVDNTVLISQGSSVQDKGWGTSFLGMPASCTPESSGGAGYGWLEHHDNCLGFNVERNWNVTKTGTSAAIYTGPLSALGPMMSLSASGGAGMSAQLDYGTVYACNPYQQTKMYGFFWLQQAATLGRFEVGLFNASGLATISLVADVSVNPNFFFLVKEPGKADVTLDTGEPVGTKRHSFGITRTSNSGLTLHFDCRPKFVAVAYTIEALTQPRYKMTALTATAASVFLFGLTLRTTSDTYVTNWAGEL